MNFNGRINEWEAAAAAAIGTAKARSEAMIGLLTDIRNAVAVPPDDIKYLDYTGRWFGTAWTPDNAAGATYMQAFEIPAGQEYDLILFEAADDRMLLYHETRFHSESNVVIPRRLKEGRYQVTSSSAVYVDGTIPLRWHMQLKQVTKVKVKTNNGFAGTTPNAGLMTGGEIDPDRHFDTNRIDTTHGARV